MKYAPLLLAALLAAPAAAVAQTSAQPVQPGYACAPAGVAPCPPSGFIPYGPSIPTTTTPSATTSTNISGTIGVTDTFQSVQVATPARKGCLIQNNGTHTMWVFFGPIGSATEATAFQLQPKTGSTQGASIGCPTGAGGVVTDQISITGTAADAFAANFQ